MTRDDAIRRIRSLIRLADGTTFPEEAKSARRKAGYLMARHGLTYPDDFEARVIPMRPVPPAPRPVPTGPTHIPYDAPHPGFRPGPFQSFVAEVGFGTVTITSSTTNAAAEPIFVVRFRQF